MASKKASLLEQSLQSELHPFTARMNPQSPVPANQANESSNKLIKSTKIRPKFAPKSVQIPKTEQVLIEDKNRPNLASVDPNFDTSSADVTPTERTPVRIATKRNITRYAFEFYQDQIESLQKYSLEEKIRGEKGSMSQMVREALDAYIAKRHRLED